MLTNKVFRHYKGYYVAIKDLIIDPETEITYVVYKNLHSELNDDFICTLDSFKSEVPETEDNPSGQKFKFVPLDLNMDSNSCSVKEASADKLIEELYKRPDNPFAEIDLKSELNNVVLKEYAVAVTNKLDNIYNIESIEVILSSLEAAKVYLEKHKSPKKHIFKVVYLQTGF